MKECDLECIQTCKLLWHVKIKTNLFLGIQCELSIGHTIHWNSVFQIWLPRFPRLTSVYLIYNLNYGSPKVILIELSQRPSFFNCTTYLRNSLEIENQSSSCQQCLGNCLFFFVICLLSLNEISLMPSFFQKYLIL